MDLRILGGFLLSAGARILRTGVYMNLLSVAAVAAFVLAAVMTAKKIFAKAGRPDDLPVHPGANIRDCAGVAAAYTAVAAAMFMLCYFVFIGAQPDGTVSFFETFDRMWNRSDTHSYLHIAEFGYQPEGEPRFFIVFFPFFPLLVRFVHALIGGSYFAAGLLANNAASLCGSILLFDLVKREHGGKTAWRTLWLFLLFPHSFFMRLAFSEGIFFLTSMLTFRFCRQKHFYIAGIFGALGAFSRALGVLLIVPIAAEIFLPLRVSKTEFRKKLFRHGPAAAIVPLGTAAYLAINHFVTGYWGTFLIHQREHWFQRMGFWGNTLSMILSYTLNADSPQWHALWLPQLLSILFALATLVGMRRLRPSWQLYALVYFFFAVSPTWLLSAPRYLMMMFPMFAAAGLWCKRDAVFHTALALSSMMLIVAASQFAMGLPIY